MKISFVIPVYNASAYLPQLIESLQIQEYKEWEALFTDDGSNDGSVNILKTAAENDGRIRLFEIAHEGSSGARNKGLENATGDIIGFIDADDFIHPQLLETVMPCFADATIDAVMFDFVPVEVGSAPPFENVIQLPTKTVISNPIQWALEPWNPTAHGVWRTFYRRNVIGELKFYPKIKHQDLLFSYQVWGSVRKMVKLECVLYAYVQTPDSVIRSAYGADKIDANFIIMRELLRFYKNQLEIVRNLRKNLFPRMLKNVIKQVGKDCSAQSGVLSRHLAIRVYEAKRDNVIRIRWKPFRLSLKLGFLAIRGCCMVRHMKGCRK